MLYCISICVDYLAVLKVTSTLTGLSIRENAPMQANALVMECDEAYNEFLRDGATEPYVFRLFDRDVAVSIHRQLSTVMLAS